MTRFDVGYVISTTDGEITFTLRKRPDYDHVDLTFSMRRMSATTSVPEEVILDDFRLDKEQVY